MNKNQTKESRPLPERATAEQNQKLLHMLRNTKLPIREEHERKWWYKKNGGYRIWP